MKRMIHLTDAQIVKIFQETEDQFLKAALNEILFLRLEIKNIIKAQQDATDSESREARVKDLGNY